MTEVLLDTCVVIDFLRNRGNAEAYLNSLTAKPAVSVLTLTEVHAGLRSQSQELAARQFFNECKVCRVTADIAEGAGAILRHYGASHAIDVPDAIIAATAEHHDLELATLNVKHFPMFKRLRAAY